MSENHLPVLDLSHLDAGLAERQQFLKDLRHAAHDSGFFYVIGHSVNASLLAQVQQQAKAFFALSSADKLSVQMIHSPHFRGYSQASAEYTRGQRDWREQFDLGAERVALALAAHEPAWKRLQGPNLWPQALPSLRPIVEEWQRALNQTALKILRALALALGLAENAFDQLYGQSPNEHAKLIRYPGREHTDSEQGVGPHKDSGILGLVLQDEQSGLQVQTHAGEWIDAKPIAGSFVVNIGELLELATNGYLRATIHRVITPPAGQQRFSIAFFLGAPLDTTVPIYPLAPELAAQAQGPATDPLNPLLREVGWNYLKGRLRSHPDVAQRYYADILAN
ncbi:2-oxoglutarate and iron-dependent oxygenase domain-containing protein [uncultured Thiothrix sp.]|uniref:isopenicillin N synthase family dioxygenase n=1 Tax=uncultured Thiothrix sp. TaxID=223185 RepID=UPI00260DBE32|nr:2-oxoglutarate and iron-dependent oxygenase domain-containing protein [uncultured Thiothrix sp.]